MVVPSVQRTDPLPSQGRGVLAGGPGIQPNSIIEGLKDLTRWEQVTSKVFEIHEPPIGTGKKRAGPSDLRTLFFVVSPRAFGADAFNPGWETGRPGWA